jgi:protoheme IX farnesyltransferase
MTADSTLILEAPPVPPKPVAARFPAVLADFWALTKPEINFLVLIATFTGFYLGAPAQIKGPQLVLLIHTLLGTLLVAGGAGTLNQYLERGFDARMKRTARRPLPSGRVEPSSALAFGILAALAGVIVLAVEVNGLAASLAVATLAGYLGLYTPLKRKTALCTLAGAVPGAMPPLIGWAAATGSLPHPAWLLYLTLFFWQFPHFMAIAWMYREDYSRAAYRVLPHCNPDRLMFWQTLLPSAALIPASVIQLMVSGAAPVLIVIAGVLSLAFFCYSAALTLRKSKSAARRTLMVSVLYLPLIFTVIFLGKL